MPDLTVTTDQLVADFLSKVDKETPTRKRLIFAIDATASRQPTWDAAAQNHGQMFVEANRLGGLDVQLVYYRGWGEMKVTRFFGSTMPLLQAMTNVVCQAGHTQLARVLKHVAQEHRKAPVAAVVLVGDCCEEPLSDLQDPAAGLGQAKIPVYCFLEGDNPEGRDAFNLIAQLTGGVVIPFNSNSAGQLRELLGAVAAFVVGGAETLSHHKPEVVRLLTHGSRS